MSTIKGQSISLITWTQVRKNNANIKENDYNGGYEYGFEFVNDIVNDIVGEQWFITESDMYHFINRNELKVLHKVI